MIVQAIGGGSFIPKCDRDLPPKEQTVFSFRLPTMEEKTAQEVSDSCRFKGNAKDVMERNYDKVTAVFTPEKVAKRKCDLVESCLTGITNLRDEKGKPVEWGKGSGTPKGTVMIVIYSIIDDLYNAIMGESELSEEEEKNSDSVSP